MEIISLVVFAVLMGSAVGAVMTTLMALVAIGVLGGVVTVSVEHYLAVVVVSMAGKLIQVVRGLF